MISSFLASKNLSFGMLLNSHFGLLPSNNDKECACGRLYIVLHVEHVLGSLDWRPNSQGIGALRVERYDLAMHQAGVAPGIFRRGADSSDEGAKIWFLGYHKCQKSPKQSCFTFRRGLACSGGGL